MKFGRLIIALLCAAFIGFAATRVQHGSSSFWVVMAPFALPGVLVAIPLAFAGLGDLHDLNLRVIDVTDFVFYSVLIYWQIGLWRRILAKS